MPAGLLPALSADQLDHDPFLAPAVEFGIENLLPGAEVQLPAGDRN